MAQTKYEKKLANKLRTLSKTANTRLRALEKNDFASSSLAYAKVEQLAFDSDEALTVTGKGEIKFQTALSKMNIQQLQHLEATLNKFLSARTSTVGGIKHYVAEGKEKFEKTTGRTFTDEEYNEFWLDTAQKWFYTMYGSKEIERLTEEYGPEKAQKLFNRTMQYYNENKRLAKTLEIDSWAKKKYTKYKTKTDNPFSKNTKRKRKK